MFTHNALKISLRLLGLLLSLAVNVHAAGLAVSPLRLDLRPGQQMTALTVSNTGSSTLLVQGSVVPWQLHENANLTTLARPLLLSPVLFKLPPGGRQLVRIGWQQQTPAPEREQAYRVFMQEVPNGLAAGSGLKVNLRIGVPLFVAPADSPVKDAQWLWQDPQNGQPASVIVHNNGNRHERFTSLKISDARQRVLRDGPLLLYVLPGASAAVPISASEVTLPLLIETRSDQGQQTAALTTPGS